MQAWRLKLVNREGGNPSWSQCLLRVLVSLLSIASCGLGYLWQLVDPKKLNWQDRASKTRVLLLPKDGNKHPSPTSDSDPAHQ